MTKQSEQLGMSAGKARNKLMKSLLFKFITESEIKCYRCGEAMCIDTYSIEHKKNWFNSEAPLELYLDLENVTFSHLSCNVKAALKDRMYSTPEHGTMARYGSRKYACRCPLCVEAKSEYSKVRYTKENRKAQYNRTGN